MLVRLSPCTYRAKLTYHASGLVAVGEVIDGGIGGIGETFDRKSMENDGEVSIAESIFGEPRCRRIVGFILNLT